MPIDFPKSAEVKLERAPLAEVICQVRYPSILMISKEQPADFQQRVRKRFPELEIEQGVYLRVVASADMSQLAPQGSSMVYRFVSADPRSMLTLTQDFYALSTQEYDTWAVFSSDLALVHDAHRAIYEPAYASRIGLRYINILTTNNTGETGLDAIADVLRPELTAMLRTATWHSPIEATNQVLLDNGDERLVVRLGFRQEENESGLVLDLDYYEEGRLPIDDTVARCERYHETIHDAFRWSIREDRLDVFRPQYEGI